MVGETDDLEVARAMKSDKHDLGLRSEVYEHDDVPVRVAAGAYGRFCGWIDRELGALVARWSHVAPPSASRPPRFRFRTPKLQ
ncbi:MAG: hypothetical protein ABIP48_28055 [Planctomycetota bacterium]